MNKNKVLLFLIGALIIFILTLGIYFTVGINYAKEVYIPQEVSINNINESVPFEGYTQAMADHCEMMPEMKGCEKYTALKTESSEGEGMLKEVTPEVIPEIVTEEKSTERAISEVSTDMRIITLDANRWEYSQREIRIQKGEKVTIKINNVDTLHGIAIPTMRIVGNDQIVVDTSKTGEFEFRCANYCGGGHQEMTGKLIIE